MGTRRTTVVRSFMVYKFGVSNAGLERGDTGETLPEPRRPKCIFRTISFCSALKPDYSSPVRQFIT